MDEQKVSLELATSGARRRVSLSAAAYRDMYGSWVVGLAGHFTSRQSLGVWVMGGLPAG